MTTPKTLAQQIKALAEKATEGPWQLSFDPPTRKDWQAIDGPGWYSLCEVPVVVGGEPDEAGEANADLIVLLRNNVGQILAWKAEAERMREALERAISFVQALADNDPDEPIADNGMTVLGKLQFDAPALIFKMRAAIGGEQP